MHQENNRQSHPSIFQGIKELANMANMFYRHGGIRALPLLFFGCGRSVTSQAYEDHDEKYQSLPKGKVRMVGSNALVDKDSVNWQYFYEESETTPIGGRKHVHKSTGHVYGPSVEIET
jgi:hypothetical protein